jgi:hypothetical protein
VKPVTLDEIAPLEDYDRLRPEYRRAVIAYKRLRRASVGEKVTLLFEDHETLRFQVHEMIWVERISDPRKIQREIDVYNELMPGENELSATLFIEITDAPEIRSELDLLLGIDEHVSLVLGEGEGEESLHARFDANQIEEDRIAAVQYIRFAFSGPQALRFCDAGLRARIRIDHPNYRRDDEIPDAVRASLIGSLQRDPPPLLSAADLAADRLEDEVLFEDARVRAVRPARPEVPGEVIVEATADGAALLEAEPALLLEMFEAVKRIAAEIVTRYGACRIRIDVGAGEDRPRWHLHPPVS